MPVRAKKLGNCNGLRLQSTGNLGSWRISKAEVNNLGRESLQVFNMHEVFVKSYYCKII